MTPHNVKRLATVIVMATGLPASAMAQSFEGPNDRSVDFYGQLSFGLQHLDDGADTETNFVDSGVSTSRLGFNYNVPFGEDSLRFNFETALGFPRSDDFSQTTGDSFHWSRTDLRKVEIIYSSMAYGTFSLGQGSMATNGATGEHLSGTSVVATPNPTDLAGNFEFRTAGGALSGIELDDAFGDLDGSRRFRVRYDTPEFNGFSFGVAYGEEILTSGDDDTYYDVAMRYEMENDALAATAALGYEWRDMNQGGTRERFVGSVGVLFKSAGVSMNVAFGDEQNGSSYGWVQLGWEGDLIPVGSTSFSIDYWDGSDFNVVGSASDTLTLAAVQHIDACNLDLYLAYRTYSYNDAANTYLDADLIFAGARWRF